MTEAIDPPQGEQPARRARARRGRVEGGIVAVALAAVVIPLVLSGAGSSPPPPAPVPALSGAGTTLPDEAPAAAPADAAAAQGAALLADPMLPEPPPPGPPVVESALPPADLSTAPPAPDAGEAADVDGPRPGSLGRWQKLERVERELSTSPASELVPADAPPPADDVLPEPPFGQGSPPPWAGDGALEPPAAAPPAPLPPGSTITPPAGAALPAVRAVDPGTAADLPASAFGTPVVVTGDALQSAEYWTVDGERVVVASAGASRVVLVVAPGRARGAVQWHAGTRSAQAGPPLEQVVPQVVGARPVVWGRTCRFPQQTGLTWVGGDDRGDLTAQFVLGGQAVAVRALDGRGLLLLTGPADLRPVEIRRGSWFTRISVRPEPLDLTRLASVSALAGERCPSSAGETAVAIPRNLPPGVAVTGVYIERRPQAFVRLPDGRVAVLLAPQHRVSGSGTPPERLDVGRVLVVDDTGARRRVSISPLDGRILSAVSRLADAVAGGR